MGSITDLSVDGYPLLQTKSAVIPEVMTIFRETDRRLFVRNLSERNELIWGKPGTYTDLLSKSLFHLGASPRDIARLFSQKRGNRAA